MNQYEAERMSPDDLVDALNAMSPDLDAAISALMAALRRIAALEARVAGLEAGEPAAADPPAGGDGPDDAFAASLDRAERSAWDLTWDLTDRFAEADGPGLQAYRLSREIGRMAKLYRGALELRRAAKEGGEP